MHFPTFLKKALFTFSGRLHLSDPVRNAVYGWAWGHLRKLPRGSTIVDIGSRDSLFPSFLAWRKYVVRVVERDARFTKRQKLNARRWRTWLIVDNCDFMAATVPTLCDAVCSLFSLQHSGENDVSACRKAATVLRRGGLFLSATEYDHAGTRFQLGRDDGDMRIYGPLDVDRRIEAPLFREGMVEYDRQYFAVCEGRRVVPVNEHPEKAAFLTLLFMKE